LSDQQFLQVSVARQLGKSFAQNQIIVPDYPHTTEQLSQALALLVGRVESVAISGFHVFAL
jgi:hypothetical protein